MDVTHPVFHVDTNPDLLAEWRKKIAAPPASRPPSNAATPSSPTPDLLRRMFAPSAPFLDGLATYLLKLGPDALPDSFDKEIERRLAATPNAMSLRVRLQQIAGPMVGILEGSARGRPIRLISIGGGTGIESMNAMIEYARRSAAQDCQFTIEVLDISDEGSAFGRAALSALRSTAGPLAGTTGNLNYIPYSWDEPQDLAALSDRFHFGRMDFPVWQASRTPPAIG